MKAQNSEAVSILKSISPPEIQRLLKSQAEQISTVSLSKQNQEIRSFLLFTDVFVILSPEQTTIEENALVFHFTDNSRLDIIPHNASQNPENQLRADQKIVGIKISQSGFEDLNLYFHQYLTQESILIKILSKKLFRTQFHRYFKPLKRIGKGAFANVYKAKRYTDGNIFAVKAFSKAELSKCEGKYEGVLLEVNILRNLNHQSVMKFYGAYDSGNSIYLVFEEISGCNLWDLLKQAKHAVNHETIPYLLFDILAALKHLAQRRIIHRDVKPQNIMVRSIEMKNSVLIDFGLAQFCDRPHYLVHRCGTPGFISSEVIQTKSMEHVQPKCDVFSAGATFFVMLVKRPLFPAATQEEAYALNKKCEIVLVPEEIEACSQSKTAFDLLTKMLNKNPEQRISAAEALRHPYFQEKLGNSYEEKLHSLMASQLAEHQDFKNEALMLENI